MTDLQSVRTGSKRDEDPVGILGACWMVRRVARQLRTDVWDQRTACGSPESQRLVNESLDDRDAATHSMRDSAPMDTTQRHHPTMEIAQHAERRQVFRKPLERTPTGILFARSQAGAANDLGAWGTGGL